MEHAEGHVRELRAQLGGRGGRRPGRLQGRRPRLAGRAERPAKEGRNERADGRVAIFTIGTPEEHTTFTVLVDDVHEALHVHLRQPPVGDQLLCRGEHVGRAQAVVDRRGDDRGVTGVAPLVASVHETTDDDTWGRCLNGSLGKIGVTVKDTSKAPLVLLLYAPFWTRTVCVA